MPSMANSYVVVLPLIADAHWNVGQRETKASNGWRVKC
jgi:hypothetical protein